MKNIKYILLVMLLSVLGCSESEEISSDTSLNMVMKFGEVTRQVIFDKQTAVVNVPVGTSFQDVQLEYIINPASILIYDEVVMVSGAKVGLKEAEEFLFSVVAQDQTWEDYRVTVLTPNSSKKKVTRARIGGIEADIKQDTIKVVLPFASDVSRLRFEFEHNGIAASLESGLVLDFSRQKVLTIDAIDKSQQRYVVAVEVKLVQFLDQVGIIIQKTGERVPAVIDGNQFTAQIPYDIDLSQDVLFLDFQIPEGYTSSVARDTPLDLTAGVPFNIVFNIKEDLTLLYQLTVSGGKDDIPPEDLKNIARVDKINLQYSRSQSVFGGSAGNITEVVPRIDHELGTIVFSLPYTTVAGIEGESVPYTLELLGKATVEKSDELIISYTEKTRFVVTSEDGNNQREYSISFEKDKSPLNELFNLGIEANGDFYSPVLVGDEYQITLKASKFLTDIIPRFDLSEGATASIFSGEALVGFQLDSPKEIVVTAENGDKRTYYLTISQEALKSDKNELLEFFISDDQGKDLQYMRLKYHLDSEEYTHVNNIRILFPVESDINTEKFRVSFNLSHPNAQLFYNETVVNDGDYLKFTQGDQNLTVVAENGDRRQIPVFVSKRKGSSANDITSFSATNIDDIPFAVTLGSETVLIEVPSGTDISQVKIAYTISNLASREISDGVMTFQVGVSQNFVVTSQSGLQKVYKVTVIENDAYMQTASRTQDRLLSFSEEIEIDYFDPEANDDHEQGAIYTITYGENNFVKTITNGVKQWEYSYDIYNRLFKAKSNRRGNETIVYKYNKEKIVSSEGYQGEAKVRQSFYVYDNQNRLVEYEEVPQKRFLRKENSSYTYYNDGNLKTAGMYSFYDYDKSKNPFMNLFPSGYFPTSEFYEIYQSKNNARKANKSPSSEYKFHDLRYNSKNYLESKKRTEPICKRFTSPCDTVGVKTITTTYIYE